MPAQKDTSPAAVSVPVKQWRPEQLDCSWSWSKFKFTCGDCASDSDCEVGKHCAVDLSTRRTVCMQSECAEDTECPQGKVCRLSSPSGVGLEVKRCVEAGRLSEGANCVAFPHRPETACAPGLACVEGVCGTACTPGDATSCPAGFTCSRGMEGYGCFDSCGADNPCAEGSTCVTIGDRALCRVVTEGPNCLDPDTACPADRTCTFQRGEQGIAFRCQQCCNPMDAQACGEGGVCGSAPASDGKCQSVCFQRCGPKVGGCPQGYKCATVTEELDVFGCVQAPP